MLVALLQQIEHQIAVHVNLEVDAVLYKLGPVPHEQIEQRQQQQTGEGQAGVAARRVFQRDGFHSVSEPVPRGVFLQHIPADAVHKRRSQTLYIWLLGETNHSRKRQFDSTSICFNGSTGAYRNNTLRI